MATNIPRRDEEARRERYRDNDDVRNPLAADERDDTKPEPKSEARGDAREARGNTARDTDTDPTGSEGNDNTQQKPRPDDFDRDLDRT